MNRKTLVNGMLIILALLLVVGMAYQFTPNLSSMFSGRSQGTEALKVNGTRVTVEELENVRRSNPVLGTADGGVLGDDFKTYVVAQRVQQALVTQAAQDIKVSRADVDAEVTKIRESRSLQDNKAWTDFLQSVGLTDAAARGQIRDSLAVQRKVEEIKKAVPTATDAEAKQFYDLNPERFQSDPKIVGRMIAVADEAKAKSLLAQVKGGADFAKLASENSLEFGERGGALGPIENGQPRAVAQVTLPTEVGNAAFALTEGAVTDVVKSGARFYIVKVEKIVRPTVKPFAEAKADAVTAVNEQKQNAALEAWVAGLEKGAKIEYVDANWKTENPVVATVAGQDIRYSEVVARVVSNEQVAGLLQQVPGEQAAQLVNGMLKPQLVEQLIASYAAGTVAKNLKLPVTGTREEVAAAVAAYGARNVTVSDADLQAYYTQNKQQFESAASANVMEINFADQQKALTFARSWNGEGDLVKAAARAGGAVSERGDVTAGDQALGTELSAAIFDAKTLRAAGEGSLTDVVKVGERFAVAYVKDLQPAVTQPLSEVEGSIREQVLARKRAEAGQAFLQKQVDALKPVNKLEEVLKNQEKRVTAAEVAAKLAAEAKAKKQEAAPAEGSATGQGETAPAQNATPKPGEGAAEPPAAPADQ